MRERMILSWDDLEFRLTRVLSPFTSPNKTLRVYGVPRGGFILLAGLLLRGKIHGIKHVPAPNGADVIADDIIDSGTTRKRFRMSFPGKPFVAAVDKTDPQETASGWIVFPWEQHLEDDDGSGTVLRILELIGENPRREGLQGTPARVVRSWSELYSGYGVDPASVVRVFEDGACQEMVVLRDIEFFSTCEHHLLPFFGKAHVAYIPDGKVIGVSKLARLLEVYSRRLQIQERIGQQVTGALMEHLKPKGAACIIQARHLCMACRGVAKQHSVMVTSSLEGVFKTDPSTRNELMSLIREVKE